VTRADPDNVRKAIRSARNRPAVQRRKPDAPVLPQKQEA